MKKMNRRDYLLGLGATAGALASTPKLEAFGQQRNPASKAAPSAVPTPDWPIGNSLPDTPTIQMFFVGIMGFRYDAQNQRCEIGIHHGSATHKLKVTVVENPNNVIYQTPRDGFGVGTTIEFGILGKPSNVSFYQVGGRLIRTNRNTNSNDFRWLFDVEHDDFYGFRLPLKERVYRQKLTIDNGVFYTHALTYSNFDIVGGRTPYTKIYVPTMMGAKVTLGQGECAFLKVNGAQVLSPNAVCQASGKTYQFWFSNNCAVGERPCAHSDFYLNFDAIDLPHDQRFEVELNESGRRSASLAQTKLERVETDLMKQAGIVVNDEAPCMGMGFGKNEGFPPL